MGAGLSKEKQRGVEYRKLSKIKKELEAAGVGVVYRRPRQLVHFENENSVGGGFNISFSRQNASNSECCLYPVIYISQTRSTDGTYRGWWDENTYNKGFKLLVQLFGAKKSASGPDARVENHGSLCILTPLTPEAVDWIGEHTSDETQYFGRGIVVEPRYIADIVNGMIEDGLVVR